MSKLLFDNSDSESDDVNLKTDNSYASNYDNWRQKEELNKLKTKYGEGALDLDDDENSANSSSDSDESDEEISPELEKEFFKALSSLKNKDPRIYDESFEFFKNPITPDCSIKKTKKKKDSAVYIKDYERKMLLENDEGTSAETQPPQETYVEEQNQLKQNLKDALKSADGDDGSGDWGGLFKTRQKTKEEQKKEEDEYRGWLAGRRDELVDKATESDLRSLKDYWSDPNLGDNEKFLRDYVLNERFRDKEDKDYVPTYEEIIHDSDEGFSEDEAAIEKQEEFEHKYNYRFEEPDQEFIKRYPRSMENSVRQQDDRRKIKRAETKQRKQEEKRHKMEEIKQMQALKRKEIEEKINKLREITGNTDVKFNSEDVDDDFDPDAHDRRMGALFNDDFYGDVEGEQKPEFPELDDELEIENWDNFDAEKDEPTCEEEDFNMDCDYDPQAQQVSKIQETRERRKRKRKSKFAKAVGKAKPAFDPQDRTYGEYLDEYYKLDCEDIIGDVPCRFKYRQVVPNDFGLTVEEILLAKDKELNRWCSIKKAVQYRPENVEKYDVVAFSRKAQNAALKKKTLPSLFAPEESPELKENEKLQKCENAEEENKRKRNREKSEIDAPQDGGESKLNKKRKKHTDKNVDSKLDLPAGAEKESEEYKVQGCNNLGDKETASVPVAKRPAKKRTKKMTKSVIYSNQNENVNSKLDSFASAGNESEELQERGFNSFGGETSESALAAKQIGKKRRKGKKKSGVDPNHNENVNSKLDSLANTGKESEEGRDFNNLGGEANETAPIAKQTGKKKRRGKKKSAVKKENELQLKVSVSKVKQFKRKPDKNKKGNESGSIEISDARLTAYGLKPKKFKNRIKYGRKN